ncbi:MAG: hypothetical protein CML02_02555 [Pseudooceanicola sp.]|nr:hypothetical protein [Pseudooceanicola sp.]|tara:strand:+ start:2642 stop:3079 length:438 start_codon:yes stop_codon:yes gene_type:complete
MRLTATFRLDGPLPINSTFEVPWADHISVGLSPRSYFGFAASSIFVTTNSAGVVIGAGVDAYPWPSQDYETASGGMNWAQATYTREFAYTCERHGHCIDIEHRTASTSGQGTIEIISPVPLPASGSVLLAGLGALILRRSLQRTL